MKTINYLAILGLSLLLNINSLIAQELPKVSPSATVEQRIGLTDIKITYSRPSVKGRVIWGELVPYDEVWRVGANRSTLITFSDDVKVEGQSLKAGTYSFFVTPTKTDWKVMFNSATDGWGAYQYKKDNDVLTLSIQPNNGMMQESMSFNFDKLTKNAGSLFLNWEKISLELKIEVEVDKKAWVNIDKAIAEAKTDENKANVYRSAAEYTVSANKKLDEGLKWINKSIKAKESWYSYWVKADVQHAKGDNTDAIKSAKKAMELGEKAAKEKGKPFTYKKKLEKLIESYKK